jgi:heme/copper-type cytochrome/quinol oxidase subunit 3
MSATSAEVLAGGSRSSTEPDLSAEAIRALPFDESRGSASMAIFVASEVMVFVGLFFSYFYTAHHAPRWPPDAPPKLPLALGMLGALLLGSVVMEWGRSSIRRGNRGAARIALVVTVLFGIAYIVQQVFEYLGHLEEVRPSMDAYGSIFYVITTVHGAHLVLGILFLLYALILPLEPARVPPHRPFSNAALYWHFLTIAWIATIACLYLPPNL